MLAEQKLGMLRVFLRVKDVELHLHLVFFLFHQVVGGSWGGGKMHAHVDEFIILRHEIILFH